MAAGEGYRCANADCTVVADTPRLVAPHPGHGGATGGRAGRTRLGQGDPGRGPRCAGPGRGHRLPGRRPVGAGMSPARKPDRRQGPRGRPDPRRRPRPEGMSELGGDQVEGRRAVLELLSVGRRSVRRILLAEDQDPSPLLDRIEELAVRMRVPGRDRAPGPARHHRPGPSRPRAWWPWPPPSSRCRSRTSAWPSRGVEPFLLVCAGLTDPRNLGALVAQRRVRRGHGRRPAAATARPACRPRWPRRRPAPSSTSPSPPSAGSPPRWPRCASSACGPSAWPAKRTSRSTRCPWGKDRWRSSSAARTRGWPPLVRRRCDAVAAIPQHGALPSLNVGVAGAVACFEVARQRAVRRGGA